MAQVPSSTASSDVKSKQHISAANEPVLDSFRNKTIATLSIRNE